MTRFVERLEARGLVTTRPDRADRRAKQVAITSSGRGALRRARAELRRLLAVVAAHRGVGGGRRHTEDLDPARRTPTERRP